MLFSELKRKEVINLRDCNKLGHVTDLEFDKCTGCIHKLFVSGRTSFIPLLKCEQDFVICFKDIRQIGPDVIIVDIC
ncbi:MAG: YlmC/YmxH family sporulation protein [Lachnospiraceae bacterium]|nr:YlmC/YmxH family sporulation protein [Lachnospiraceae bacterium]